MLLPKEITSVTPLSKSVALILFISLPIVSFLLGMRYQSSFNTGNTRYPTMYPSPTQERGCTLEAKICPDGSSVGREGPNCEFAPCTQSDSQDPTVNELPPEATRCTANSDCLPTCAHGCISNIWKPKEPLIDCLMQPDYTCSCINNTCVRN